MNDLQYLRLEAYSGIAALHNIPSHVPPKEPPLIVVARFLQRSPRTLARQDARPEPDRLTEFAYRYLAGYVFGWPGARFNLKTRELQLYESALKYHTVHQRQIENIRYSLELQRLARLAQERRIEELQAEIEALQALRPQRLLASWLQEGFQPMPPNPASASVVALGTARNVSATRAKTGTR